MNITNTIWVVKYTRLHQNGTIDHATYSTSNFDGMLAFVFSQWAYTKECPSYVGGYYMGGPMEIRQEEDHKLVRSKTLNNTEEAKRMLSLWRVFS